MTTKTRALLAKNAEVTKSGIKVRGDPVKGNQKTIVVNETTMGKLKKKLLTCSVLTMASGNAIGLYMTWVPDFVHVAYPLGTLTLITLFTIAFTKME